MLSKSFMVVLLGTTAIAAATSANAQTQSTGTQAASAGDAAPQTATDLNSTDIVVTATRRAESLQEVPMSVNAVTGDQLQKLNILDVKDVQQLVPGLEITNTTGRSNTTTLRGITFDPDQGTSPAVQVYYDGVPADAQTVYTAIYDISQIEVLHGPQGLLRGLSAPAGTITIATQRPTFDAPQGYVQSTVTSRDGYNVQGAATLPFSSTLSLRVAALVDGNRLNDVYNINRDERSRSRTESARASLGWRPSSNFDAYLTYQYLNADNIQNQQVFGPGNTPQFLSLAPPIVDPTRSGPPITVDDYEAVTDGRARYINNSNLLNLAWDWDLGPATLSFVGAHQYSVVQAFRDYDGANAIPNATLKANTRTPYKVDTGELRLTSNNHHGFGWGIGAFYTKQTGTVTVDQDQNSYFAPLPVSYGYYLPIEAHITVPVYSRTWSFNANASYETGPFRIEGGLRYSLIKNIQTADIFVTSPGAPAVFIPPFTVEQEGIPANLQKSTYKPLTGAVTMTFDVTPDLTVYAAYGHAYRTGSAGVSSPVGISDDLIKTNPEKTDSWEAGIKGKLFDHRLSYTFDAYYQKIDGFLSRFPGIYYNCPEINGTCFTSPPAPPINNATDPANGTYDINYNGNATIKGFEATLSGNITPNWDFGLSMSLAHARYDHARLPCNDFAGTGKPNQTGTPKITGTGNVSYCVSNGRLAEVPDFSLSANSEIRVPMGKITPFARALLSYRPSFYSDMVNYRYQDREILNLYLGFRTEDLRWEFSLFAKNALNQHRITNISGGVSQVATASGLSYNSGYYLINATNPREFGLSLGFHW